MPSRGDGHPRHFHNIGSDAIDCLRARIFAGPPRLAHGHACTRSRAVGFGCVGGSRAGFPSSPHPAGERLRGAGGFGRAAIRPDQAALRPRVRGGRHRSVPLPHAALRSRRARCLVPRRSAEPEVRERWTDVGRHDDAPPCCRRRQSPPRHHEIRHRLPKHDRRARRNPISNHANDGL